jgi:hypothetical protein
LPSNYQHDFALYLSSFVMLVYDGLALHRDLSELEESSTCLPLVMCLMPSTSIQQGMWDVAIISGSSSGIWPMYIFFAITFAEDGGQLPSSFGLLHLKFYCNSCLIVWKFNI